MERRVMHEEVHVCSAARRVTLVSTRTRDTLTFPDGSRKTIPGGPANYIGDAFRLLGLECNLVTGDVAEVDVISSPHGEEYVIPALTPIEFPQRLECAALLLSPIVREIDPDAVPEVDALLIIDLQGFVREPGVSSGDVRATFDLTDLLTRSDVVKASESEVRRLTAASRKALDGTILLTTLGERGALVRCDRREQFVPARVIKTPYTIGAGDSYLAAFTAAMLDGCDPIGAAEKAARFTEDVLRQRSETS
jgi:sugar/nucleoside kinase (ribokinase family)